MSVWKYGFVWILWILTELSTEIHACLDREQFLAGLDRLTSLVFEAELLQFGDTDTAEEVYVRVTRIIRQPETGWHLQPGNIAHLTGIRPRATDTVDCLPARVRGHIYLWATWNSAVNLHNADHSLELIPGGLFPAVDVSPQLDWNVAGNVGEDSSPEVNSRSFVRDLEPSTIDRNDTDRPCDKVQCQFGAICETWPSSSNENRLVGVCVCPQIDTLSRRGLCDKQNGPICAHNGRLYENECGFQLAVCVQQSNLDRIELPSTPPGVVPLRQLCAQLVSERLKAQKTERFPELSKSHTDLGVKSDAMSSVTTTTQGTNWKDKFEDKPQQDAAYPYRIPSTGEQSFVLEDRAQSTTDCDGLPGPNTLNPVCGTDGVTYLNEHLLRQRSCLATATGRPAIRINYISHCHSHKTNHPEAYLCLGHNICQFGGLCPIRHMASQQRFNPSSSPGSFDRCLCEHINCLGLGSDPICATDGLTYSNECFLKRRVCETQTPRDILYRGPCASNPCLGYTCRWAGERCQVDETGQPKCVCPQPCPNVVSPVCGSDHVTYDSHCHLERTACMKMRDIFILYAGQCTEEPHCDLLGLQCQGYEICSRVPTPHVQVPGMSRYPHPWSDVMGDRGNTEPVQLVARCLCPTCPERGVGDQVCGTDGQTYRSECHLRASACQRQLRQLKVRARGSCDACKTKDCPYHAICRLNSLGEPECICPTDCLYVRKPVCGTDGKMYENECFLKVAACAEQRDIHVAQEGPCATCPFGCPLGYQCLKGECVCRRACPKPTALEAEVCGSDGQIYPSECELKRQACLRQTNVRVDPSGAGCRDMANRIRPNTSLSGPDSFQSAGRNYLSQPQADETIQSTCTCNTVGALSEYCDYRGRCHCKWGVRGKRCDQCMPNYWGIQNGHECIACSCHPDGSLTTTCDAMTGQCQCRQGVLGRQCSICPEGGRLTKIGCVSLNADTSDDSTGPDQPNTGENKPLGDSSLKVNGRRFKPETTLLVRAPFPLREPFSVQMVLHATAPNGTLLFYQLAPTKQEQMFVENPTGKQFVLDLINGQIELRYVSNGPSGRMLTVRSAHRLELGKQHTVRAGVTLQRPWIQLDTDPETTMTDIEERKHEASVPGTTLSSGGHGTIVVGRQVLPSASQYVQPITKGLAGFSGCLLQLILRTESPVQEQNVDLISGDRTELAWIGVDRLPSGLAEAPLCRSTDINLMQSNNQVEHQNKPQSVHLDSVTQDQPLSENPCDRQPCGNGGSCELTSDVGYTCVCLPGWQGHHCDQVVTIVPQFHRDSFIRLPGPNGRQAMQRKRLHIEVVFLLIDVDGLILLIPPSLRFSKSNDGPFISVYVDSKGFLVVHCRVGHPNEDRRDYFALNSRDRLITFRYSVPIPTNQWHTLFVEKRTRALTVQLNDGPKERIRTVPENFRRLSRTARQQLTAFDLSESPIYLGGFSTTDRSVPAIPVRNGMKGAVQKLSINGAEVVLARPANSNPTVPGTPEPIERWFQISQWQGPPCGPNYSPCALDTPESVCRPHGSQATCACSTPLQLWQLMREKPDNLENTERKLCLQRKNELNKARARMLADKPPFDERRNELVQHDEIPKPKSNTKFDQITKSVQSTYPKPDRCGRLPIAFKGHTTMTFNGLIEDIGEYNLRVRLTTRSDEGLVLFIFAHSREAVPVFPHSVTTPDVVEITTVALVHGHIEYTIQVPVQTGTTSVTGRPRMRTIFRIRSDRAINDGQCHTIHIARSQRSGTLITDHHMISSEFQDTRRSYRQTNNVVFLGGLSRNDNNDNNDADDNNNGEDQNDSVSLVTNEYRNFTGCIGDVFVNEHNLPLLTSASELRGPVEPCQ